MIVAIRLSHSESHDDLIQESWFFCIQTCAPQIVAGVKYQFVHANFEKVPGDQRRGNSPVGIGYAGCHATARAVLNPVKLDPQTFRRDAAGSIENVRRQVSHRFYLRNLSAQAQAQTAIRRACFGIDSQFLAAFRNRIPGVIFALQMNLGDFGNLRQQLGADLINHLLNAA